MTVLISDIQKCKGIFIYLIIIIFLINVDVFNMIIMYTYVKKYLDMFVDLNQNQYLIFSVFLSGCFFKVVNFLMICQSLIIISFFETK